MKEKFSGKLTSILLALSYVNNSCEDPANIFKSTMNFSVIFCCYKQRCRFLHSLGFYD